MPRALVVSNGRLYVNFDPQYQIRDITYPYVGQRDHTKGHPWRFGIWVDGQFEWSDGAFERTLNYLPDSLVTDVLLDTAKLGLQLRCNDLIHYHHDLYIRKIEVRNLRSQRRNVRLFFHHDPYLSGDSDSNTVIYDSDNGSLVAYKDDIVLVANAMVAGTVGFQSYACGKKGVAGLSGCWKDAEDGNLQMGSVSQGSVDSVGSVNFWLEPNATETIYYWIAFGDGWKKSRSLSALCATTGPEVLLVETDRYWRNWVTRQLTPAEVSLKHTPMCHDQADRFADLSNDLASGYRRSVLTMRAYWDHEGAFVAAIDNDFRHFSNDTYGYFWPRDGAMCALAMDVAGHGEPSRQMFQLCARLLTDAGGGYLLHKYYPSGSLASSWHSMVDTLGQPVLPIQEDETALIIVALESHYRIHRCTEMLFEGEKELYKRFVVPAANFLAGYRDKGSGLPKMSYDLWEERHGVTAFQVGAVFAGLKAAARLGAVLGDPSAEQWNAAADEIKDACDKHLWNQTLGRFVRMVTLSEGNIKQDLTLDSSIFALWYFGLYTSDDPRIVATMQAIEARLWVKTEIGGMARYEGDYYHQVTGDTANVPGNPWIICTLWLAQWYIDKAKVIADLARAKQLIEWTVAKSNLAGLLPEQLNPFTGAGLSVSPLTWSHATLVLAVKEYVARYAELTL